jgi:hypothetical protein
VATIDFSSIPATYTDLELVVAGLRNDGASDRNMHLRFNNDSGAHYYRVDWYFGPSGSQSSGAATETSFTGIGSVPAHAVSAAFCSGRIFIPDYAGSFAKAIQSHMADNSSIGFGSPEGTLKSSYWNQTTAINQLTLSLAASNFDQGKAWLYGRV